MVRDLSTIETWNSGGAREAGGFANVTLEERLCVLYKQNGVD